MNTNSLRLVHKNAADVATLTTDSQVPSLPVSNLKNNYKGVVWRSSSLTCKLEMILQNPQPVSMVALLYTNLSPSSEIKVTYWANSNFTSLISVKEWHTAVLQPYSHAVCWLATESPVAAIRIEIRDVSNPEGFIQAARLLTGECWSPQVSADYGLQVSIIDTSPNTRTESGALRTQVRPRYRSLQFSLNALYPEEGRELLDIMEQCGTRSPIFISIHPDSEDKKSEGAYQLYGKLQRTNPIVTPMYQLNQTVFALDEI